MELFYAAMKKGKGNKPVRNTAKMDIKNDGKEMTRTKVGMSSPSPVCGLPVRTARWSQDLRIKHCDDGCAWRP